jgi:hypothetical protein
MLLIIGSIAGIILLGFVFYLFQPQIIEFRLSVRRDHIDRKKAKAIINIKTQGAAARARIRQASMSGSIPISTYRSHSESPRLSSSSQPAKIKRRRKPWPGPIGLAHVELITVGLILFVLRFAEGRHLANIAVNNSPYSKVEPWYDNVVVHTANAWSVHLPWGSGNTVYELLALSCLIIRFWRSLPIWISFPVSVIDAVYGTLIVIAVFPYLVATWPLTVGSLFVSCIVIAIATRGITTD